MRIKGFTLIELMLVVAIVGLLAAIAVPKFANMVDRAHESVTKGQLGAVRSALHIFYATNEGTYPTCLDHANCSTLFTTLVPQYLNSTPSARLPSTTCGAGATSVYSNSMAVGPGVSQINRAWFYDGSGTNSASLPATPRSTWGSFYVNCPDPDLKDILWNTY